jgi:nucleoside 2-deoxyribosyltransferase
MVMKIYVIGSMRNPRVPEVAKLLRTHGHDAFDDWYSAGPEADDKWQEYERDRGRTYLEAINGHHARHVYALDYRHLAEADAVVLVMPAGRSGHLELGWAIGTGKPGFVLFDAEPERFDIMYRFVYGTGGAIVFDTDTLIKRINAL